jgi:hypothetical protein
MAPQNKIEISVSKVMSAWRGLSPKIVAEIMKGIGSYTDPAIVSKVIAEVFKKYKIKSALSDTFTASLATAIGAGARRKVPVKSIKRWFVDKAYDPDVKKFKASINDLSRTSEITGIIRRGMAKSNSWRQIAQDMRNSNIQVGDVAKDVQGLIAAARQSYALTGDVRGYKAYEREIMAVKKRLDKLVDPSTSKLKAAYSQFVKLTDGASADAVERAAKYAVYHKQAYNAERIARTEMARAYGQASQTDLAYDEDAIGWKWILNASHGVEDADICNFHAEANLYGMGAGVYPKNHGPELPAHPNCVCQQEPVYKGEAKESSAKDFDKKAGIKYLESQSNERRKKLMGIEGAEKFSQKPKTWTRNLRNYEGQKPQPATIPKDVLYGKE